MHGGNLRLAKEIYGSHEFVDLSSNINPYGPPTAVWDALKSSFRDIVSYPDPECKFIKASFSDEYNIPMENIIIGNGAGELLFTILRALKPKKVLIPIPSFSEYERSARSINSEISYMPIGNRGWNFLPNIETSSGQTKFIDLWKTYINGCELLFLCSPHNPTGSYLSEKEFQLIVEIASHYKCKIIFDESFYDFLPDEVRWSAKSYISKYPNLIVLYSLTKFYALPGLRLGIAFSSIDTKIFENQRDPWSVNSLAQIAGVAAMEDKSFPLKVRKKLLTSKDYLYKEINKFNLNSFKILPSTVNFSLIKLLDNNLSEIVSMFAAEGILVRDCSNFKGINGNFIRIAIKDIDTMKFFLSKFEKIQYVLDKKG